MNKRFPKYIDACQCPRCGSENPEYIDTKQYDSEVKESMACPSCGFCYNEWHLESHVFKAVEVDGHLFDHDYYEMKEYPVCESCKSKNIEARGMMFWQTDEQDWIPSPYTDLVVCNDCEQEVGIEWRSMGRKLVGNFKDEIAIVKSINASNEVSYMTVPFACRSDAWMHMGIPFSDVVTLAILHLQEYREIERKKLEPPKLHSYKLTWEIDIEAEHPIDAALEAEEIQRDPASAGNVFKVKNMVTKRVVVCDTVDHHRKDVNSVCGHCGAEADPTEYSCHACGWEHGCST